MNKLILFVLFRTALFQSVLIDLLNLCFIKTIKLIPNKVPQHHLYAHYIIYYIQLILRNISSTTRCCELSAWVSGTTPISIEWKISRWQISNPYQQQLEPPPIVRRIVITTLSNAEPPLHLFYMCIERALLLLLNIYSYL